MKHQALLQRARGETRPQRLLFAAATVWSMAAVPLWLMVRELGLELGSARIVASDWHGYAMLFGYALAVVGGFLIAAVSRAAVGGLFGIWLLAQIAALVAPFAALHAAASALFAIGVAVLAAPKLFRGPSQLRNRVFGPVVMLLCAAGAWAAFDGAHRMKLLLGALDLYVVLLVFMGGRLIAAAAAGQFYRRGERLDARVQPRIEIGVLGCVLLLAGCDLLSAPELAGAALALCAALLLLIRWMRWRLWTCAKSLNLAALGVGYFWLPLGLVIRASRMLPIWLVPTDALHCLTAGAIGSLTLLVMGRTRAMASAVDPEKSRVLLIAAVLVNVAAVLRLLGGLRAIDARSPLLLAAAASWAAAFAILAGYLATLPAPHARARPDAAEAS